MQGEARLCGFDQQAATAAFVLLAEPFRAKPACGAMADDVFKDHHLPVEQGNIREMAYQGVQTSPSSREEKDVAHRGRLFGKPLRSLLSFRASGRPNSPFSPCGLKGGGFAGRLSTVSVPPNARADPSVS